MISVLINNHNYGQYVGEAIESVLNQTYQDFEIIVVDGGSEDQSRDVIQSYVRKYPQKITAVYKPSSGQAAAINVGFQLSRGDIIALLDSDDYFMPTKLEKIAGFHKTCAFVGHGRRQLTGGGELVDASAPLDDRENRSLLYHRFGYIYTYNLITSCISATRSLMSNILPMPEEDYVTFADCYIKVMAQNYCDIQYYQDPLTFYRIHPAQRNQAFQDAVSAAEFAAGLYKRVFADINQALRARGEETLPMLTLDRLAEAFALANPTTDIRRGGTYAIYGAGISAYKIYNIIRLIGGEVVFAADSDRRKWGTRWMGLEVVPPEELLKQRNRFDQIVIGTTTFYQDVSKTLRGWGLELKKDFSVVTSLPND